MLNSCIDSKNKYSNVNLQGSWYFLDEDSIYTEIYFDKIRIMSFSEKTLYMGPYNYTLNNDKISFNGLNYRIKSLSCRSMEWSNPGYVMDLNRIESFKFDFSNIKNDRNSFFLRKYTYLVNNGLITANEALNIICNKSEINSKEYIEENIKVNR